MKYGFILLLAVLGLAELVIRCTVFLMFLVLTVFIIGFIMLEKYSVQVQTFLTPTCLVIASKLAESA